MRLHESWGREWFLVGRERTQNVKTFWAIFFSHLDSNTPILWRESSVIYSWSIEYAYVETDQRLFRRECAHSGKFGCSWRGDRRNNTRPAALTPASLSTFLRISSPLNPRLSIHLNILNPHSNRIHVPTWAPTAGNTIFFSNYVPHLLGFCHGSHIHRFLPRSPTVVPLDWEIIVSFQLYTRRAVHHPRKLQDSSLVVLRYRFQVLTRALRFGTRSIIRF